MMHRHLVLTCGVIIGFILSVEAIAQDDKDRLGRVGPRTFVGLWVAIDSFDGSTQRLSITCSTMTACDMRLNDSLFTLSCKNRIGFARGKGTIARGEMSGTLTLTCKGQNDEKITMNQFTRFVADLRNGTVTNLNDDPSVPNVFHRISR